MWCISVGVQDQGDKTSGAYTFNEIKPVVKYQKKSKIISQVPFFSPTGLLPSLNLLKPAPCWSLPSIQCSTKALKNCAQLSLLPGHQSSCSAEPEPDTVLFWQHQPSAHLTGVSSYLLIRITRRQKVHVAESELLSDRLKFLLQSEKNTEKKCRRLFWHILYEEIKQYGFKKK